MFPFSQLKNIPLIAALAAILAIPAAAHEYKAGDLMIEHPWTRATPAGAKTAGGYVKITNHGQKTDTLIGGSADGAGKVEIHEMKVEDNVMKMRKLQAGLAVKPGETVELKPGSFHIMMMGLKAPYKEGETVKGTLAFEKAGKVDIEFKVEAMGTTMDHGAGDKMEGHDSEGHGAEGHKKGHH